MGAAFLFCAFPAKAGIFVFFCKIPKQVRDDSFGMTVGSIRNDGVEDVGWRLLFCHPGAGRDPEKQVQSLWIPLEFALRIQGMKG